MHGSFRPNRYSSVYLFLLFFGCVYLHIYIQPLYIPFVYAELLRLNVCHSPCSCFPHIIFDSLKSLLLFVTFQTSALTYALCGSPHVSFALIWKRYLDTAFSFLVPMLVRYFAFVTESQCGLQSRLFPTYARCRCVVSPLYLSGGVPCMTFRRHSQRFAALAL